MVRAARGDAKIAALRHHHALNPTPAAVTDPAFTSGPPFFDARDLVQVKYEMLRRVQHEGQSVSQAARAFGFSRPSFYLARRLFEESGLPGLVPQRPGPRRAHKLGDATLALLEQALAANPALRPSQLAELLRDEQGLEVHPRSIERALARQRKRGRHSTP